MLAVCAACPSQPIQPTSTNQKTPFAPVNLSMMHFIQNIQIPMKPFSCQNFKANYTAVPYADHGTERVKVFSLASLPYFYVAFMIMGYTFHFSINSASCASRSWGRQALLHTPAAGSILVSRLPDWVVHRPMLPSVAHS